MSVGEGRAVLNIRSRMPDLPGGKAMHPELLGSGRIAGGCGSPVREWFTCVPGFGGAHFLFALFFFFLLFR